MQSTTVTLDSWITKLVSLIHSRSSSIIILINGASSGSAEKAKYMREHFHGTSRYLLEKL